MREHGPWGALVPYAELRRRQWQLRGALVLLVVMGALVLWVVAEL